MIFKRKMSKKKKEQFIFQVLFTGYTSNSGIADLEHKSFTFTVSPVVKRFSK